MTFRTQIHTKKCGKNGFLTLQGTMSHRPLTNTSSLKITAAYCTVYAPCRIRISISKAKFLNRNFPSFVLQKIENVRSWNKLWDQTKKFSLRKIFLGSTRFCFVLYLNFFLRQLIVLFYKPWCNWKSTFFGWKNPGQNKKFLFCSLKFHYQMYRYTGRQDSKSQER